MACQEELSKLSLTDDIQRAALGRQRNRSLKKSAAVDDEPSSLEGTRRASSFDVSQSHAHIKSPNVLRPSSFDCSGQLSAFSPLDVPRLFVHSPNSPFNVEQPTTPDNRLLTVPSPDFARKSSPIGSESPKPDYLATMSLAPALLAQVSAFASMQATMAAQQAMDTTEPPKPVVGINPFQELRSQAMDCTSSIDSLTTSLDLPGNSCIDSSHGGSASAELMAQMPPKAVIQDDIRSGQGRFQLVRKRGRSEVWNLFGQVFDTHTNVRLPYVACYACKVLYTDTGGGTGNMTRHRCPIGMSYRNSAQGSSTDTVDQTGMSSFESTTSIARADTKMQPISLTIHPDSGSSQLISQNSGEVAINDMDREFLTDTVIRCCAQDMVDPNIFAGKGFRLLLDRLWQLAKRAGHASFHEVFPDSQMLSSTLQTNLRFCADDLKNELSQTSQGVCLSIESLSYNSRDYKVIHGSRINTEWKWRSNVLGVFKARENQSLSEIVNLVAHNYELDKNLLRVTCNRAGDEFAPIRTFADVKEKLKEILLAVLNTSQIPILPMMNTVNDIMRSLAESDVRLPFEFRRRSDDIIFNFYYLLDEWNTHVQAIEGIIKSKSQHLINAFNQLNQSHLKDVCQFLEPFKETVESLLAERPNFHKVLPEWYAIMHECQSIDEDCSTLLRDLKQKAHELLTREKESVLSVEHRIAAILNPRLNRRMSPICTDQERQDACDRIREISGIRKPREPLSRGSSSDGEPSRKRRMFLNALEDDTVGNDELECYLRSQFPVHQTKDLITFWNSVGQSQFPKLSSLARRILSVPATAPVTEIDYRLASVSPEQLHTFLMLRSMFETTERDE